MHISSGLRKILENDFVYNLYSWLAGEHKVMNYFLKDLDLNGGSTLLDIGCGTGGVLKYLPTGCVYFGYDFNPKYVAYAQKRWAGRKNAHFTTQDIVEDINLQRTYDYIVAIGVLHHLDDGAVINLLETARRHMHKESIFMSIDPTIVRETGFLARTIIRYDRGKMVRTPEEISALVGRYFSGLEIAVKHNLGNIPFSHVIVKCK